MPNPEHKGAAVCRRQASSIYVCMCNEQPLNIHITNDFGHNMASISTSGGFNRCPGILRSRHIQNTTRTFKHIALRVLC